MGVLINRFQFVKTRIEGKKNMATNVCIGSGVDLNMADAG